MSMPEATPADDTIPSVTTHVDRGIDLGQGIERSPVRGRGAVSKQSELREQERPRAHRRDLSRGARGSFDPRERLRVVEQHTRPEPARHDEQIDRRRVVEAVIGEHAKPARRRDGLEVPRDGEHSERRALFRAA